VSGSDAQTAPSGRERLPLKIGIDCPERGDIRGKNKHFRGRDGFVHRPIHSTPSGSIRARPILPLVLRVTGLWAAESVGTGHQVSAINKQDSSLSFHCGDVENWHKALERITYGATVLASQIGASVIKSEAWLRLGHDMLTDCIQEKRTPVAQKGILLVAHCKNHIDSQGIGSRKCLLSSVRIHATSTSWRRGRSSAGSRRSRFGSLGVIPSFL
jgi:hypothetical protein